LNGCSNLKELPSFIGQLNTSKSLIWEGVPTWNNYLPLLTNWNHSQNLICKGVLIWKNYVHLLANLMRFRSLFTKFSTLWKHCVKIHSSVGELNALKVFHLSRCSNLK
jgi:hypothetical protein